VSCKLCGLHSHITIFSSRFPLCGCVSCKLCSHHSHITIFSSRFLVWLCQLQTLQASQPHNYFSRQSQNVMNVTDCDIQKNRTSSIHRFFCERGCKVCRLHSHSNYFIITLFGVAVSAAKFAGFTATLLFSHHAFLFAAV
jgi:hypothetical protein